MGIAAVSTIRSQAMGTAVPPNPGSPTASFRDLLASMQPLDRTVVRQGDCLSRICSDQLKELGGSASSREIHEAVQQVAKANHIANPDKIYAGQKLNMSVLAQIASRQETPTAGAVQGSANQWQSLVEGAVTLSSKFGLRKDPFTGQMRQHDGIDVAAPTGAPISVCAAGSVVFSGWKHGYGNTVIIRHEDGLESLYGHVSKSLVHVGEQVAAHTPIAYVGSTGRSTGAHLHFEVRRDGQALDPLTLLNGKPLQIV